MLVREQHPCPKCLCSNIPMGDMGDKEVAALELEYNKALSAIELFQEEFDELDKILDFLIPRKNGKPRKTTARLDPSWAPLVRKYKLEKYKCI